MGIWPSITTRETMRSLFQPGCAYGASEEPLTMRTGTSANAAWPAAKWILYMSFTLDAPTKITHLWWMGGGTAGTDSIEMGIYNLDGVRLGTTGVILTAVTAAPQSAALALTLDAGTYYLAITCNGVTDTFDRYAIDFVDNQSIAGFLEEIPVVFGLPAVATFATPTKLYMPIFGFSTSGAI